MGVLPLRMAGNGSQLDEGGNCIYYYNSAASHSGSIKGYSGFVISVKTGPLKSGGASDDAIQLCIAGYITANGNLDPAVYKRCKFNGTWSEWEDIKTT